MSCISIILSPSFSMLSAASANLSTSGMPENVFSFFWIFDECVACWEFPKIFRSMQDNRDSEKFCMAEKKVFWKPLLRIPEANDSLRRGCARLRVWLFLPETRYEAASLVRPSH